MLLKYKAGIEGKALDLYVERIKIKMRQIYIAIMPQEVAILINQVLKEAVEGWNYNRKAKLQWHHVSIRHVMQKANIVFYINYNKLLKWWNKRRRQQKELLVTLEKNRFNTLIGADIYLTIKLY